MKFVVAFALTFGLALAPACTPTGRTRSNDDGGAGSGGGGGNELGGAGGGSGRKGGSDGTGGTGAGGGGGTGGRAAPVDPAGTRKRTEAAAPCRAILAIRWRRTATAITSAIWSAS